MMNPTMYLQNPANQFVDLTKILQESTQRCLTDISLYKRADKLKKFVRGEKSLFSREVY
jgi:hypothetical protein